MSYNINTWHNKIKVCAEVHKTEQDSLRGLIVDFEAGLKAAGFVCVTLPFYPNSWKLRTDFEQNVVNAEKLDYGLTRWYRIELNHYFYGKTCQLGKVIFGEVYKHEDGRVSVFGCAESLRHEIRKILKKIGIKARKGAFHNGYSEISLMGAMKRKHGVAMAFSGVRSKDEIDKISN